MAYTTSDLLSSIERRSFAPAGQATFTTSEILSMADEEMRVLIVPNIMAVHEEFFVTYEDFSITANQYAYAINARAIGQKVREVQIVNDSNNVTDLPRKSPTSITSYGTGSPAAFYLKNNSICLNPVPSAMTNILRSYFFLRPGNFIETTSAAVISAIASNTITVTSIPASWTTGDVFDLISRAGGHPYLDFDLTSTSVSGNDITFSALPDDLAVGDYVSLAGYSPLVQIPPDYQPVLAQAVAVQILENMGRPSAAMAKSKLKEMLDSVQKMISTRVEGEPQVIQNSWGY